MPRFPIMVPRSGIATISPNGVTRFWSGVEGSGLSVIPASDLMPSHRRDCAVSTVRSALSRVLPAALGPPLLVELLDSRQLIVGQVAIDGPDVRLKLFDGPGTGDDAVDARLGQQPAQSRLGHVLAVPLQEPKLLDAIQ